MSLLVIIALDAKDPKLTFIAFKIAHKGSRLSLLILKVTRDIACSKLGDMKYSFKEYLTCIL